MLSTYDRAGGGGTVARLTTTLQVHAQVLPQVHVMEHNRFKQIVAALRCSKHGHRIDARAAGAGRDATDTGRWEPPPPDCYASLDTVETLLNASTQRLLLVRGMHISGDDTIVATQSVTAPRKGYNTKKTRSTGVTQDQLCDAFFNWVIATR